MKVAVPSESAADEAAVRILIDGILGLETEPVPPHPSLRTRGWPSVSQVLAVVLKHLHYHTDAEALALVVDSNHSPVHRASHDQPGGADAVCRLCHLRETVGRVISQLRPVPGRATIKTAIGLAVPAIEAWYRCGRDPHVTEAAWLSGLESRRDPYSKNALKESVYGTDRPTIQLETSCATDEARRLATNLGDLESLFPNGFGPLVRDVHCWTSR
jgi:hypothetical protein